MHARCGREMGKEERRGEGDFNTDNDGCKILYFSLENC